MLHVAVFLPINEYTRPLGRTAAQSIRIASAKENPGKPASATNLPAAKAARQRMTNVDFIASHLQEIGRPGDRILITQWYCGVSFRRYYRGRFPG